MAASGRRQPSVSVPSRPPHMTKIFTPSSAPRSIAPIAFWTARARTAGSLAVNAPSLKAGSVNRFVVTIGTTSPWSPHACRKSRTMRSRLAAVASMGTRSLSCRFTPQAPTSPSSATSSPGVSRGRTGSPKGSRPGLPTVHRPNENLCSARGT